MAIMHAQPPSTPASVELEAVKKVIAQLESRETQSREHLSRISLQTAQQLQATGNATLDLAERPLPSLLQEATVLDAGVMYLDALEVMRCCVSAQMLRQHLCTQTHCSYGARSQPWHTAFREQHNLCHCTQELQQTVTGLRSGLSSMQALLDQDDWHSYLAAVLQDPLQQYKHVQASSNAFMEVSTIGLPDRLIRQGSKALSKGKQAQVCPLCHATGCR